MNKPISKEKTWCLTHQLPETQVSPYGLVCECCKKSLYLKPPQGKVSRYWEKLPGAFSLHKMPFYVHVMVWPNYAIRSLHMIGSGASPKPPLTKLQVEQLLKPVNSEMETLADLLKQRDLIADFTYPANESSNEPEFKLPSDEEFEFDLDVSGFDFEPPKEYDPHEQEEESE